MKYAVWNSKKATTCALLLKGKRLEAGRGLRNQHLKQTISREFDRQYFHFFKHKEDLFVSLVHPGMAISDSFISLLRRAKNKKHYQQHKVFIAPMRMLKISLLMKFVK